MRGRIVGKSTPFWSNVIRYSDRSGIDNYERGLEPNEMDVNNNSGVRIGIRSNKPPSPTAPA